MNKRLTKNIFQTIGGVLSLITLMCAGLFLYARWDLKRFKQSLEELPEALPVTVSEREKIINTYTVEPPPTETTTPKPLTQHNIELESDGLETATPSLETLDSLIDELALSEVELSETATSDVQLDSLEKEEILWTDEFQEEIDNGSGFASLISALESSNDIGDGSSEDITIVVQMLKRAAKSPVTVDDLITMTEAWLRIQPDTPHVQSEINETRYTLTNMLSRLRTDKEEFLQSGEETKYSLHIY